MDGSWKKFQKWMSYEVVRMNSFAEASRIRDVQMVTERKEERERVRYVELIAAKKREGEEQARLAEAEAARLKEEEEEAKAAEEARLAAKDAKAAEEKGK